MFVEESAGQYSISGTVSADEVLKLANQLVKERLAKGQEIDSSVAAIAYLQKRMAEASREVFSVLFLDSQHRIISLEDMFFGTIAEASVYPREIVAKAIELNAGGVILTHNHPSGVPEPSRADLRITERIKEALALIEIKVLDHVIVGSEGAVSFANRGLI
ncbi:DNA repair protein RadC [Neiella sp. HB171785]|uniref:DNA repair protein RadC n=1 Tax=Neiella litorisoli TaxID=2771431 RepID=A0A8J6QRV8_9GAMM|nr:DNA repair protein RadC [Neiella litorisoli]MBD1389554.1 DNA repair protein RadC [Neiella litorisoli]